MLDHARGVSLQTTSPHQSSDAVEIRHCKVKFMKIQNGPFSRVYSERVPSPQHAQAIDALDRGRNSQVPATHRCTVPTLYQYLGYLLLSETTNHELAKTSVSCLYNCASSLAVSVVPHKSTTSYSAVHSVVRPSWRSHPGGR